MPQEVRTVFASAQLTQGMLRSWSRRAPRTARDSSRCSVGQYVAMGPTPSKFLDDCVARITAKPAKGGARQTAPSCTDSQTSQTESPNNPNNPPTRHGSADNQRPTRRLRTHSSLNLPRWRRDRCGEDWACRHRWRRHRRFRYHSGIHDR